MKYEFVDALQSVLARYTSTEVSTIVRSVTGQDGVAAWARPHAKYNRITQGIRCRLQRECIYPKPSKDVGQVRLLIMQREEKWQATMSELGKDTTIPESWRLSALLEICPKDVRRR